MKVINYLGAFDRLFGVAVTTRNWNTIAAIARVLESSAGCAGMIRRDQNAGRCGHDPDSGAYDRR